MNVITVFPAARTSSTSSSRVSTNGSDSDGNTSTDDVSDCDTSGDVLDETQLPPEFPREALQLEEVRRRESLVSLWWA